MGAVQGLHPKPAGYSYKALLLFLRAYCVSGPIQAALSWRDLELVFSLPLFPALTRPLGRGGDSCSFLPFSTAYLFRAALPSNPATFWAWELVLPPGLFWAQLRLPSQDGWGPFPGVWPLGPCSQAWPDRGCSYGCPSY